MTAGRRHYQRPTALQRQLLAAYVDTGTIAKAAERLHMTVPAAYSQMADARRRTGMTTERMIYVAGTDGWFPTQEFVD